MQIKYISPLAIILKTRVGFTISLIHFSEYWHTNEIQNLSVTFHLTKKYFRQANLQECISVKPWHFCLFYLLNIPIVFETIQMKINVLFNSLNTTTTNSNIIIIIRYKQIKTWLIFFTILMWVYRWWQK